jgi:hypothetical protein
MPVNRNKIQTERIQIEKLRTVSADDTPCCSHDVTDCSYRLGGDWNSHDRRG